MVNKIKSNQKKSSEIIGSEVVVAWDRIAIVAALGVFLGLCAAVLLFEKPIDFPSIIRAIDVVLVTCALALLLDIRRILIKLAK